MKRMFDVVISLLVLFWAWPVLLVLMLVIRVKLGSPIFFKQERPGLHAKPFQMVKFRTMTDEKDQFGNLLDDRTRLTRFGKLLRSTSLDELPELWNVLKGDMSLVGPRPLLMEYVPLYTPDQFRRHNVKPGITGWAQVNGRNAIGWDEKFILDIWYVENRSLLLDLKILLMTLKKVICRDDINGSGEATMSAFKGTQANKVDCYDK